MARRIATKTKGKGRSWRGGGKYTPRRRVCSFCTGKIKEISYKDTSMLGTYISDRGKIEPRRRTGTCAKHQRALAVAIKRARHLAMLPFAPEHIYRMGDVASINYSRIKVEQEAAPEPKEAEAAAPEAAEEAKVEEPVAEAETEAKAKQETPE